MLDSSALTMLLDRKIVVGDSLTWLAQLPDKSVNLFFMSPPYADARSYSRIDPDYYVEWFLPFAKEMYRIVTDDGSMVINIKNRVAKKGPLKGQRHPYVYNLVLALQSMQWRWLETYIWSKPNAIPGKFGPRTKDAFEYVYHFAKGLSPYCDLAAVRVPYKTAESDIQRRLVSTNGRRNTDGGFGRDRSRTYNHNGADPGNVVAVAQTYNQYYGVNHTAPMPELLAEFFIKLLSPVDGIVIDPFAGSGTTVVVGDKLGRQAGGIELHSTFATDALKRINNYKDGDQHERVLR